MSKNSVINQSTKFAVADYIRKRIRKQHDGTFRYVDDCSDSRVATHFGITENNVRAVRMAAFGPLISNVVKKAQQADLTGAGIIKRLEKVESIMSRLCNELGVNYE
jgi:hypothetical protein